MEKDRIFTVRRLAEGGIIAALYVVFTYVSYTMNLSGQLAVQLRLSEALTVLPFFTVAAVPGLTIGCLLANLLTGSAIWDVIFGTLATLIGAVGTYLLRKYRYAASIPPILANTIIIPFVLKLAYQLPDAGWLLALSVFLGELICCGVLGTILQTVLIKNPKILGNFNS
ncbi:MAG: QueT transporter family protein [Clostridia bacterium]|nr:QueT transporter family protein [Clostridia bacterium]